MTGTCTGVCFIINDYNRQTDTHYRHLYRLIEEVSKKRRTRVLVETPCSMQAGDPLDETLIVQRQRNPLLRVIEELVLLVRLRQQGFWCFYVHYTKYGGILAPLVARLSGGKAFYWHCEEVMKYRRSSSFSLSSAWRWIRTEGATSLSMRLANRVVTGNRTMLQHYQQAFGLRSEKFFILPNYIDLSEFAISPANHAMAKERLCLASDTRVVLYVHRLAERKGANYLPEIIERVTSQNKDVNLTFVIVGDGPYRLRLEAELEHRSLWDCVRVVGQVPSAEIAIYYAASDVFIMPSDAEGFPRVLLEAMATGVPFVATDVGGVRELLNGLQHDFVCPPGNIEYFTAMLTRLLREDDTRKNLIDIGYTVVKRYSLEDAVSSFLNLIDKSEGEYSLD